MQRVLPQLWLLAAGVFGLVAVAAAAYGRHAPLDASAREMVAIGSQFQLGHALALLGVAWLGSGEQARWCSPVHLAGAGFVLGTVLFSGSLYALALRGAVPVAGAAPLGGWLLMLGWLCLALTAVRNLFRARTDG